MMSQPARLLLYSLCSLVLLRPAAPSPPGSADPAALSALLHGHLQEASTRLHQRVADHAEDALSRLLLCRTSIAAEQPDDAVADCMAAAQAAPRDAATQMWLGRALGLKASHANPIAAYKLAGRVREAFEKAVQLDPNDVHAVSDLAEFYLAAPSVVGGNVQQAERLANGLMPRYPAAAHRLLGMLAHKNGQEDKAESEFKQEIAVANAAEAWIDLALYYTETHKYDQAEPAVTQALALDQRHGPVEVDAATILITAKREANTVERALRAYLASNAQTDEAPVPKVHVILGKQLGRRGDTAGARAEFNAALALAPNYVPAQKALGSL